MPSLLWEHAKREEERVVRGQSPMRILGDKEKGRPGDQETRRRGDTEGTEGQGETQMQWVP
jgi:hypothetical protein